MQNPFNFWLSLSAVLACIFAVTGLATSATRYVVTNDDPGVSFYTVAPDGALTLKQQVQIGGFGNVAGFFGTNRISVLNGGNQQCVFASVPSIGHIAGIVVGTLTVGGNVTGSPTDGGTSNGIGLATNGKYLYASFTDSNTIGTFQVLAGCGLAFVNDASVGGLAGGIVNAMAIHGNMLITTYTDGTIESFDISGGTPVSQGDKQYSSATLNSKDATYPNSIDITSDGHFAIFGDTSTAIVVEISDISTGKLTKTTVHRSTVSISASNVMLSPDETLLYVVNTQGDSISVLNFDKNIGKLSAGCTSSRIKGESAQWSYLAGLALASQTGNGGGVYVAEFGSKTGVALVSLSSSGRTCVLQEVKGSPFVSPGSLGILSVGTFPPRSF
jgi:DNA-binding beta-propeller fold protein YncE